MILVSQSQEGKLRLPNEEKKKYLHTCDATLLHTDEVVAAGVHQNSSIWQAAHNHTLLEVLGDILWTQLLGPHAPKSKGPGIFQQSSWPIEHLETLDAVAAEGAQRRLLCNLTQTEGAVHTKAMLAAIDGHIMRFLKANPAILVSTYAGNISLQCTATHEASRVILSCCCAMQDVQ